MAWYGMMCEVCEYAHHLEPRVKKAPGNLREGPTATKINSIRYGKEGGNRRTITKTAKEYFLSARIGFPCRAAHCRASGLCRQVVQRVVSVCRIIAHTVGGIQIRTE